MLKLFYINITAVLILFFISTAFLSNGDDPVQKNDELINFSHSLHYDFVSCDECHSTVVESTSLKDRLLPNHDNCVDCHEVDNDEECETCHKNDNYEPLIQKSSSLIFNHKIHYDREMDCDGCHAGLSEVDYSFESAMLNPPMENCAACHNETKIASNACESCHIAAFDLIPQSHRNVDYMRSHKFLSWELDANCMMCHNNSTCQECHIASNVITETNLSDDFYQPYMPGNGIDGVNQQVLLKVHGDLNYRYSHGIDAKGKSSDCQTCHQIETFCSNCHSAENRDFALSGIVPSSHLLPDFKTIGVGTGGGEHAILARRDIERCVSCHDVQGADPTCILCHLDNDGIKGTNPKTHVSNYIKNEKGDWHDSMGSICYNCHTSASPMSQPTDGFCNYCHGL